VPVDTIVPVAVRLVPVAAPITGVVSAIEVLVHALIFPLATVPKAGVTNVGPVNKRVTDSCLVVLVVACTIGNTSAPA
jgi:hypothetical protein